MTQIIKAEQFIYNSKPGGLAVERVDLIQIIQNNLNLRNSGCGKISFQNLLNFKSLSSAQNILTVRYAEI